MKKERSLKPRYSLKLMNFNELKDINEKAIDKGLLKTLDIDKFPAPEKKYHLYPVEGRKVHKAHGVEDSIRSYITLDIMGKRAVLDIPVPEYDQLPRIPNTVTEVEGTTGEPSETCWGHFTKGKKGAYIAKCYKHEKKCNGTQDEICPECGRYCEGHFSLTETGKAYIKKFGEV